MKLQPLKQGQVTAIVALIEVILHAGTMIFKRLFLLVLLMTNWWLCSKAHWLYLLLTKSTRMDETVEVTCLV